MNSAPSPNAYYRICGVGKEKQLFITVLGLSGYLGNKGLYWLQNQTLLSFVFDFLQFLVHVVLVTITPRLTPW